MTGIEGKAGALTATAALLFAVLFAALVSVPAEAQNAAGLSSSEEQALDAVFEPWNRSDRPGCTFSLAKQGQVLYEKGFGMAQLEQPARIGPDTIFEAGSVSKQFTAAAIVLLALDGKLSLDDEVRRYLPEVPDFGTPITLRQMLNHTSGLRTFRALVALRGRPDGRAVHTNHEILELVEQQEELNFTPGEEYLYSNNGYILSALVVERVSGKSFEQFSQERIFQPLGMTDTQWRDDFTEVVPRRATAYETGPDGEIHTNMSFSEVIGNGGLLTTVHDLQLWNRELDAPEVLGEEFVRQMETRGRFNDGSENFYALGLEIGEYRGMRQISHSGGTAGYRSYLARYPDNDRLSIALLCNDGDLNPVRLSYRLLNAYLGEPAPESPPQPEDSLTVAIPESELQSLAGPYLHTLTDSVARVSVADGMLKIGELEAEPRGGNRFYLEAFRMEVEFQTERGIGAPRLRMANDPEREYVAMPAREPDAAELAEYAGSYYSDELEIAYSVYVHQGQLLFEAPFEQPRVLEPLFRDFFEMANPVHERFPLRKRTALTVGWIAHFERNALGRVDSLFISEGTRIRRLRFERR